MRKGFLMAAALAASLPIALAVASPSVAAPAGSTTVTVKGHITSPTGKAIPGVQVSVYSTISGHHVVARARTSRTGRYAITVARSEWSYQLKVLDYGDSDADHGDGEWAPILRRFDFTGGSTRIDQVLHHGARISGRVSGRDGRPVGAGVQVGVSAKDSSAPGSSTLTRADGTFRITNASAGDSLVAFTSPRADESTRWYSKSSITGTRDESAVTLLHLAYGKTASGIRFRFPYIGRISGSVTVDGQKPTEEGSSVAVVLLDSTGKELSEGLANPDFTSGDLLPGAYRLEFRSVSSEPGAIVTEYYRDSSTLAGAVPLVIDAKGHDITGLTAHLTTK